MKVAVDLGLCQGYGNCVSAAPDFFDLDDSGQAVVLQAAAETDEEIALVRAAAPMCPMGAISLND
ncbi:MAG TPA: ferredoxin [Trebonia sp.]|jgi:ferredoxin|nr:ferredoxin [Trebonia sp.]